MPCFKMFWLTLVICTIGVCQFARVEVSAEDPREQLCTKEEVGNCWSADNIVYGRKLACQFNKQDNRSMCMYTTNKDIDTLEVSGSGFITILLRRFQLIYPTVSTFILRDSPNPVEFANVIFFNTRVKNLIFDNSKVLANAREGVLPNKVETISGLVISNNGFQLQNFSLNNLRYLEVSTEPGVEHNEAYFKGVPLTELHYSNQHIAQFAWNQLPESLENLVKVSLTFSNVTSLNGQFSFSALRELKIVANDAKVSTEFLRPSNETISGLTQISLSKVIFTADERISLLDFMSLITIELSQVQGLEYLDALPLSVRKIKITNSPLTVLSAHCWGKLESLKELHIDNSEVRSIDSKFFQSVPRLSILTLNDNELSQIFIDDNELLELEELELSRNLLTSFSYKLVDRPLLTYVNLGSNNIGSIQVPTQDFFRHESSMQLLNLAGNNLQCSCDMIVFCALFKPRTSIKGVCTEPNGHFQVLCRQDYDICPAAVFSRSQRSLVAEAREQRNLSVNNQTETEVHEILAKVNEQTKLETKSRNLLRPNYGVGFQFRGQLYGSLEKFKVHINVYWKSFVLPRFQWNLQSFQELCRHQDQLIRAICQDFVPLVKQAVLRVKSYSKELDTKLRRLSSVISGNIEPPNERLDRNRRDILETIGDMVLSGNNTLMKDENVTYGVDLDLDNWKAENDATKLYQGFFPWYGGIRSINQQHDRNKAMASAIKTMANRQNLVKNAFIELRTDLSLALTIVADTFENTSQNVVTLHKLLNETNFEIKTIFGEVQNSLNVLQQKVHGIRVLSVLTTKYLDLWAKQVHNYFILNLEADQLLNDIADLSMGKISPHLLPPERMTEIINKVAVALSAWHKDYELVYEKLSHFYYYSEVQYLPTDKGVMMQLLWPVKARSGQKYDLYLTSSVHMPAVTTPRFSDDEANHDFSRIELTKRYLGVSDTNFVELNLEELDKCFVVEDTYLCYQAVLELDNAKHSCLSALYLNATVEEISQLCSVDYFFSPFSPSSSVIDAGDELLVSGLSLPWTQRCIGDRIPRRAEGSLYAILDRNSLCFCSIDAPNGYLARKITGCDHLNHGKQPEIKLSYVMNSLVAANFKEVLNISGEDIYGTVSAAFILPPFTMVDKVAEAKFLNMSAGVMKLRMLSQLIKQKGDDFKSDWDELEAFLSFSSLFSPKNWFRAVSFIGSIAGFIALIAVTLMFCKTRYQQGFIQSLMFAQGSKALSIGEICADGKMDIELSNRSLIYLNLSHVTIVFLVIMLILTGRHLIRLCCREARVLVAHPALRKHPEVEIYLELHAGCERVLLYILTVKSHFSKVELKGHMTPRSLVYDNHSMYGILRPNWKREDCKVVIEGIEVELPNMIQVPLYKKRKVQNILQNVFTCSILATDGLYLYKIGDRRHEVVSEKSLNPYSSLIAELRDRERAFEAITIQPKSMIQTAEMEVSPSAPVDTNESRYECETGGFEPRTEL